MKFKPIMRARNERCAEKQNNNTVCFKKRKKKEEATANGTSQTIASMKFNITMDYVVANITFSSLLIFYSDAQRRIRFCFDTSFIWVGHTSQCYCLLCLSLSIPSYRRCTISNRTMYALAKRFVFVYIFIRQFYTLWISQHIRGFVW